MSRVGAKVRQACIDDIARSYAVETEGCPKLCATNLDAHRHKCGRMSDSIALILAEIGSSCMISSASSLRLSNVRRVDIDETSEKERGSDESAVLKLSRAAEIALLRHSISFVRSKAQRGEGA